MTNRQTAGNADSTAPAPLLPPRSPLHASAPDGIANGTSDRAAAPLRRVVFRPTLYTRVVKPTADRAIALAALCLLAPLLLLVATAVLAAVGRPVLFRQRRTGRNGVAFEMLKFRTMERDRRGDRLDVIHDRRLTHKSDRDPRHTRLGRLLRRSSLDELPQLINVLRGEMSLIGPRPELESVVATRYPPGLEQRHLVRPGLTGLWQISARGEGPMHENGEWDLDYVERISPLTDLRILLRTPAALFGKNAGR